MKCLFHDLTSSDRVLYFFQGVRIDNRDLPLTEGRHIDPVKNEIVGALVVDLNTGVAVGHFELTVARAEYLACERDRAALGNYLLKHYRPPGSVEVTEYRNRNVIRVVRVVKMDAGKRVSVIIDKARRLRAWIKILVNMQPDDICPALDQPVDIQIPGSNVDTTLCKDRRLVGINRLHQIYPIIVIVNFISAAVGLPLERAVLIPDSPPLFIKIKILSGISVGVEPVVCIEVEVILRLYDNVLGPDFS